jgi:uncharacterized membrane-anchored protein
MKPLLAAGLIACALFSGTSAGQDTPDAAALAKQRAFLESLHYRTGDIALPSASAHLVVQPGFRFIDHDDGRKVLEDYWGNPPDDSVLGLLVPDSAPLDSDHSWAVVVTYSDDGYVSDEDASKTDYNALLAGMKSGIHDENAERKKNGYGSMELVGWAQPPSYDASGKRLYWAKEIAFEGETSHTLNYDIRVLGRQGFLSLNAVASMADLPLVKQGMTQVLPMAQFDSGQRYADYQPGNDKLAGYGLAALVGGGIAAKTGLFAKLGLLLLGLKKFLIIGVVAIGAAIKKLFGGGGKKGGTFQ